MLKSKYFKTNFFWKCFASYAEQDKPLFTEGSFIRGVNFVKGTDNIQGRVGFSVRVLVARVVDHGSPTFRVAAATFWLFISPGGQRTSCSDVAHWHWKRKQGLLRNSFQLSSLDYSIAGIWGNKISPRCFHSLRIVHLLTAKFSF